MPAVAYGILAARGQCRAVLIDVLHLCQQEYLISISVTDKSSLSLFKHCTHNVTHCQMLWERIAVSWIVFAAAEYEWPSSKKVSRECKDLVSKILVADPKHRISIAGIQVAACPHRLYYLHLTKLKRAVHPY